LASGSAGDSARDNLPIEVKEFRGFQLSWSKFGVPLGVVVLLLLRLCRLPDRGVTAVSSRCDATADSPWVDLRTKGGAPNAEPFDVEAILGVRGVRPTVFAADALSCGGRCLDSLGAILVIGGAELDEVERVEVIVAVTERTCCWFGLWKPRDGDVRVLPAEENRGRA
jgi:hypothetical protein